MTCYKFARLKTQNANGYTMQCLSPSHSPAILFLSQKQPILSYFIDFLWGGG